jgi:hypothetical protein
VIANPAVVRHIGRARQSLAVGPHGRLILAVRADRQRRLGKDGFQRRLLIDEQIARAGADENLDPRRPRRLF